MVIDFLFIFENGVKVTIGHCVDLCIITRLTVDSLLWQVSHFYDLLVSIILQALVTLLKIHALFLE